MTAKKLTTSKDISPSSTTLTTAYSGWVSDWFQTKGLTQVAAQLTFSTDDATTYTLLWEHEDEAGEDGFASWKVDSAGAASVNDVDVTAADLPSSERIQLTANAITPKMRLTAKVDGGASGANTLTAELLGV